MSRLAERCRPRYVNLLPVIPSAPLEPREALEGRHPQDGRSTWRPGPEQGGLWRAGPKGQARSAGAQRPHPVQVRRTGRGWGGTARVGDGAGLTRLCPMQGGGLGLASGIVLVLLLLCLYRVLCPRSCGAARRGPGPAARGSCPATTMALRLPRRCAPGAARAPHGECGRGRARGDQAAPPPVPMCMPRSHRTSSVWPATGCCW